MQAVSKQRVALCDLVSGFIWVEADPVGVCGMAAVAEVGGGIAHAVGTREVGTRTQRAESQRPESSRSVHCRNAGPGEKESSQTEFLWADEPEM